MGSHEYSNQDASKACHNTKNAPTLQQVVGTGWRMEVSKRRVIHEIERDVHTKLKNNSSIYTKKDSFNNRQEVHLNAKTTALSQQKIGVLDQPP